MAAQSEPEVLDIVWEMLFPPISKEWIREVKFTLAYIPLLGGGLNLQPSEVDELPLGDWEWYVETLFETREQETKAFNRGR